MSEQPISLRPEIGARVRKLRQERRWSQERLAALLGISQNYLSVLERGRCSFTAEQLLTILKHFNVPIDYFYPHKAPADFESQIQNALAREGASHLVESELMPSERLKKAADAIREALVSAGSARQITAIAPILVNHARQLNLEKLHSEFQELGLEYRWGWVIDNTLTAIKVEASKSLPREWRLKYRQALIIIDSHTRDWRTLPGGPGKPPPYSVLDPEITSVETLEEVRDTLSGIAQRWRIVTKIGVDDFARALRAARGAD
jgi:transcriptional regulator with XRE-family HTH domain